MTAPGRLGVWVRWPGTGARRGLTHGHGPARRPGTGGPGPCTVVVTSQLGQVSRMLIADCFCCRMLIAFFEKYVYFSYPNLLTLIC